MKTPQLIGLTGPAGAGKDTVAQCLQAAAGFHITAFADPLRDEVANAFGIPVEFLTAREAKEYPISALAICRCSDAGFRLTMAGQLSMAPRSPRQIMQWWGTEYRRAQDVTWWTKRTNHRIEMARLHGDPLAITDVRFPDEADLIRRHGGSIWQVKRPGLQATEGTHASAVTGNEFAPDVVIENDGGLDDLRMAVEWALRAGVVA
jgi:hypothetical protein